MKIGINTLLFRHPESGTAQYILHLLNALAEIDTHNEYVLVSPDPLSGVVKQLLKAPFPMQVATAPRFAARNASTEKLVWEQFTAPSTARKAEVDIFHVPHFAPPLFPPMPIVVTIHDAIPLRLPLYHTQARTKAYMNVVSRAAHKATMVITVSQHAKQDIIDALQLPADRIRVVYQAAGEQYTPIKDPVQLAEVRAHYGLNERYVFYMGGLDARKNVLQLVRAFTILYKQLGDPQLQLLVAGDPDKRRGPLHPDPRPLIAELGMEGRVICRFIEEEHKAALYSGAAVFVFPSLYEGFGLDPLEAMACGAPVVCSNRTSLPEVTGDAALLLDPEDTEALVEAMRRVLTDDTLRADLKARSLERAKLFSWEKTARETLAVYEETFARRKR